MEIIRNCSHYGSTITAIRLDDMNKAFRITKMAFNEDGASSIMREYDGINWYEKKLNVDNSAIVSFTHRGKAYASLELAYKDGQCGDLSKSVEENHASIKNALKHHVDIFETSDPCFNHGDYSFENVVFDKDDVLWVIDWEHFTDLLPKGFDLAYCIMEACYFCLKRRGRLTKKDIAAAKDLIDYAETKSGMKLIDKKNPATLIRNLIADNQAVFGRQVHKYPFFNSSQKDIYLLDKIFK